MFLLGSLCSCDVVLSELFELTSMIALFELSSLYRMRLLLKNFSFSGFIYLRKKRTFQHCSPQNFFLKFVSSFFFVFRKPPAFPIFTFRVCKNSRPNDDPSAFTGRFLDQRRSSEESKLISNPYICKFGSLC